MTTLALQGMVALLLLAFAAVAWRMAWAPAGVPGPHRAAWILVAVTFSWRAVTTLLQNGAAVWAFFSGAGSAPYELYLQWSPVLNDGRALLAAALGFALVLLPRLHGLSAPQLWRWSTAAALVLFGIGAYMGWREGGTTAFHLTALAILNSVELVGLLAGLLVALFAYTMDRYLWLALILYALHVALNIVWLSALTRFFIPHEWYPAPQSMHYYALAAYLGMIVLGLRRLALAREGVPVPTPLETLDTHRFSVFG